MDFGAGDVDPVGQRCDEVGIELALAAPLRDIGPRAAEKAHERAGIFRVLLQPLRHAAPEKAELKLPVAEEGVDQRQEELCLELRGKGDA